MHDTSGGEQADGFETVSRLCGKRPGLWSTDFGFSKVPNDTIQRRDLFIEKALSLHRNKVLITLSWHQCNPILDEPCTFLGGVAQTTLNNEQWDQLLANGSELNTHWKEQVDRLAVYFKELQRHNVPVLFRPYHESNILSFWWGNTDPAHIKALWRQLRDYYIEYHGLTNLVWVWSVSYQPQWEQRIANVYPGDDVVDVVGLDIYPPAKGRDPDFSKAWETLKQLAPNKPIALSEVSRLPSREELMQRPWAYVVPWGENMLFRDNSKSEICKIYLN